MDKKRSTNKLLLVWLTIIGGFIIRGLYWSHMKAQGVDEYIRNNSDGKFMFELGFFAMILAYIAVVGFIYISVKTYKEE